MNELRKLPKTTARRGARAAFTLIELLVVIAIIAILAAILFPVFAQAREKARQATCISNHKQIGLALLQYVGDYDETYPQAWSTGYGNIWYNMVQPYIKNGDQYNGVAYGKGGVWDCPSFPEDFGQAQKFGSTDGLFINNSNADPASPRSAWPITVIDSPAEKIIVAEKGRNNHPLATPRGFESFIAMQWWWADSVMDGTVYNPSKDNSNVSINSTNNRDNEPGVQIAGEFDRWEGGRTVRYRHNGTATCLFADGHVKGMTKGSIKWYRNIYIKDVFEKNQKEDYTWSPATPF